MTKIDPRDPRLARLGRFDGGEKACALWWSGAGLRIRLRCASLEAEVEAAEGEHLPWLGVEIDGAPMARLPLAAGCRRYVLLSGLDGETAHDVTVIGRRQPQIRGQNGLFNHGQHLGIPRLDSNHVVFWHSHGSHLGKRHLGIVGINLDAIQKRQ